MRERGREREQIKERVELNIKEEYTLFYCPHLLVGKNI
jgi:hypothetical protein